MSENPVRKASVEAAKKWFDFPNASEQRENMRINLALLIETEFAPVVAAAKEAMRDKCEAECEVIMQSREEGDAKGISAANLCAMAISLIPTGTALAEYTEDAVGRALARMLYLTEHPDELVPVSETSDFANDYAHGVRGIVERATTEMAEAWAKDNNGWAEVNEELRAENARLDAEWKKTHDWNNQLVGEHYQLREEIASLKTQLAEAEPIVRAYARKNPKWWNPTAENGMTQSVPQDPMGAHAWLEKQAALSAPAKEGE